MKNMFFKEEFSLAELNFGDVGIVNNLQPTAKRGFLAARAWGYQGRIIGLASRKEFNPNSDHHKGLAIDLMCSKGLRQKPEGDESKLFTRLIELYVEHRHDLKVKKIIFDGLFYDESTSWQAKEYQHITQPTPESKFYLTLQHYDHIHISFHEDV